MLPDSLSKAILGALVGFPTVSSESNLDLIDYVKSYLRNHGVEYETVLDETGKKASLFASIGPRTEGGVILSGHTDVVPVSDQKWQHAPFTLTEVDGRLYGRGTCDMKGFLAVTLAMVPTMLAAELKRPIHLAFSYDEEIGCLGAPAMIEKMTRVLPRASAVIVGEPTQMNVVTGHKGVVKMTTRIRGKAVHSSVVDKGVSATLQAARLSVWLDERMQKNRSACHKDDRFDPPYTTLHSGIIRGGTAFNITARECILVSDIRAIPHESSEDYIAEYTAYCEELASDMRVVDPQSEIAVEIECNVPSCRKEDDSRAEVLARRLTGDNGEHVVAFGTEAGQFQDAGLSVAVCGPGNMDQGHGPDEYIETSQLRACEAFQRRLIETLSV